MSASPSRRQFVVGALAGAGSFAFLDQLPPLAAQDVMPPRERVRLQGDIEPLVALIEDTPRDRLLELIGRRIREGTYQYQELLSAVMLAGVRGIQPRPVGFKFHAVLVVHSAHQAALQAQDRDRWLPLLWAIDNFKNSQEENRRQGNWAMAPVAANRLPAADQAARRFREAMDDWNEAGADQAACALARTASCNEVFEMLWRYGARDFRDIGHKAIFVANAYRTLQTIGWRHAEPIIRSLAFALVDHEGDNPARRDDERDRPWRDNLRRGLRIRAAWLGGRPRPEASRDLLAAQRTATPAEACDQIVTLLNEENSPSCLWDGLFLTAGELLMRQPGIVGLHTLTTLNALRFGFDTTSSDETRRLLLLQAAAFLPLFREFMRGRGRLTDNLRIDAMEPIRPERSGPETLDAIFADIGRDRLQAARKTLGLLEAEPALAGPLMAQARRLVFSKGNDSHDYKFSSAIFEDFHHAAASARNRYLAAAMYHLRGSAAPDTNLFRRTRAALADG